MPRLRLWLVYQVNFGTEAVAAGGCAQTPKRGVRNVEVPLLFGGGSVGGCALLRDGMLVCGCCHRGWVKVHTGLVPMGFGSENHGFLVASQFTLYIL